MAKKKEEKVNKGIAPTLKNMLVGDQVEFPITKMQSVKSTASVIKLMERKIFKTKQLPASNMIQVTRVF